MKFYCVTTRKHVEVPDNKCTKAILKCKNGSTRYVVKAQDKAGNKLTTFVAEAVWKKMKIKEA